MSSEIEMIPRVLKGFGLEFDDFSHQVFHSGHINSTIKVDYTWKTERKSVILQRVNTYVFQNPIGIMNNIELVTSHIREKLYYSGVNPDGRVLEFIKAPDGNNYFFEDRDNFWRAYWYIPNTVTYDQAEDLRVLRNAGESFGRFQHQLCDLPMYRLVDTLPGFHDTRRRMENFFDAVRRDENGRRREVEIEARVIRDNECEWKKLGVLRAEGVLPLRVTHNDTKYNNILIDKTTGEAVCVIDLDTVTPGLCAYDFGDAIRFAANYAAEDEVDLTRVELNLEAYEAFASGFVSECRAFCSREELESLAIGALTMAFELSARFLEDYLNGDKYFRIHRPRHNLERGRCQLALALDMKKKLGEMQRINRKYY